MTELKCPYCNKPLVDRGYYDYMCPDECDGAGNIVGNESMWESLIDTKKKLDRAIRVIQEVSKMSDKLSRKYGDTLVEQLDTIQAFCWEQGYILTHYEDFKRSEQFKKEEQQ